MTTTNIIPYTFQIQDIRQLRRWDYLGCLFWEQGLGKTIGAGLAASRMSNAFPMVVVCPASVKYNWQRELLRHFGMRSLVLEKTTPPKYVPRRDIYILNYDILRQRRKIRGKSGGDGWLEEMLKVSPRLVVVDECQLIAHKTTANYKAVDALCERASHVIPLSGTPITSRPSEIWTTCHLVRPELFPHHWAFLRRYTAPKRTRWGWDFRGADNLEELHDFLVNGDQTRGIPGLMLRRRKIDVLQDLPEVTRSVVPLAMSDPKEYRLALKDFITWLKQNVPGKLKSSLRNKALTHIGYLERLAAKLKLPAVFQWVDDYLAGGDGKLILFGVRTSIVDALHERYKNISVMVNGSVTGLRRQECVDRFNNDRRIRLFVGNIRAAGTGWSAYNCSDTAFVEFDWTPGAHSQASARTHGISRGREGFVSHSYYLVAHGSVEERLFNSLNIKQKNLNAILDGGDGDEMNLLDELVNELLTVDGGAY